MSSMRVKIKVGKKEVNGYLSKVNFQSIIYVPKKLVDQMQLVPGDGIIFVYKEKTNSCELYKTKLEIS